MKLKGQEWLMESIRFLPTVSPPLLYVLSLVLTAGIFVLDLLTPGYVEWLLYFIPLLLLAWVAHPRLLYMAAAIFTLLMALSFVFNPSAIPIKMALYNCFLGIAALWIGTYTLVRRQRVDVALQGSEKRFRRLFDESPIGAALLGPDFRFIALNKALSDITGYPRRS